MRPAAGIRPLGLLRACGSVVAAAAVVGQPARQCPAAAAAARVAPHAWPHRHQHRHQRRRPLSSNASAAVPAQTAAVAGAVEQASAAPAATEQPHVSVLLSEVLAAFEGRPVRRYVDGTLGAAGHATAVLRQHPELEALVGFDLDPTAHQLATTRLAAAGATIVPVVVSVAGHASFEQPHGTGDSGSGTTAFLVRSNFGRMKTILQQLRLGSSSNSRNSDSTGSGGSTGGGVDAILLDLGISSMQVDTAERGFSFLQDGPLDMRMDPGAALSAEGAVNGWPEAELARVIREYGEERHWRAIARRIVVAREEEPITTTRQLVRAIGSIGGGRGGGGGRKGKGGSGSDAKFKHPATRTFQALRIAVNSELQSVAQVLPDAINCLSRGGRLAVITFHSLEDRIVKWAFRQAAGMAPSDEQLPSYCLPFEEAQAEACVRILTRRPLGPSEEEQRANVRSRSAKLRVVEKL